LRGLLGGGIGFATLVAVLMFVAPLSSAHGIVVFTAPYAGFTTSTSQYVNHTGCAFATNPVPASWNSTTGEFQFSAAAGSGACAKGGDGYGEATTSLTSHYFSSPYPGTGYVYVELNSSFAAKAALTLGSSSGNGTTSGYAEVALYVEVLVYDTTHHNGTLVGYSSLYLVDEYFYASSSHFSLTQGWSTSYLYCSTLFTAGHHYEAYLYVGAYVFADTYGGGSTASASLNLGGTNGVVISSITAD
jgi:hypothetical protein